MPDLTRIGIIDDHEVFTEGLKALLSAQAGFEVSASATDGREALVLLKNDTLDVLLVDVDMPGLGGIDTVKELIASGYAGKILMLSMHDKASVANTALEAGAAGYVLKSDAYEQLVLAIQTVLAGEQFISSSLDLNEQPKFLEMLTKREKEICILFANGMRFDEIAEMLGLSHKTVEAHRRNVYQKLKLRSAVDIAHLVMENRVWFEQACPNHKVELHGRNTL